MERSVRDRGELRCDVPLATCRVKGLSSSAHPLLAEPGICRTRFCGLMSLCMKPICVCRWLTALSTPLTMPRRCTLSMVRRLVCKILSSV